MELLRAVIVCVCLAVAVPQAAFAVSTHHKSRVSLKKKRAHAAKKHKHMAAKKAKKAKIARHVTSKSKKKAKKPAPFKRRKSKKR